MKSAMKIFTLHLLHYYNSKFLLFLLHQLTPVFVRFKISTPPPQPGTTPPLLLTMEVGAQGLRPEGLKLTSLAQFNHFKARKFKNSIITCKEDPPPQLCPLTCLASNASQAMFTRSAKSKAPCCSASSGRSRGRRHSMRPSRARDMNVAWQWIT
jgi:hypothetical protein